MDNILEYKDGASFFGNSEGWEEKVVMGNGWAYGVEVLLQRDFGTSLVGLDTHGVRPCASSTVLVKC